MFRKALPTEEDADILAADIPPVPGAEYWNGKLLRGLCLSVEHLLRKGMEVTCTDLQTLCRLLVPGWRDLGKLCLHLAQNKADTTGEYPFAFLVSFIYTGQDGKLRYLPIADALQLYSDKPETVKQLLMPLEQAATSPFCWNSGKSWKRLRSMD